MAGAACDKLRCQDKESPWNPDLPRLFTDCTLLTSLNYIYQTEKHKAVLILALPWELSHFFFLIKKIHFYQLLSKKKIQVGTVILT